MPIRFPYFSGEGIPNWLFKLLQVFRASDIITKQDLIDYNLINSNEERIDDAGAAIDE